MRTMYADFFYSCLPRSNHPPLLLCTKKALPLLQRMNQHRYTTRLEIRRLAHLVKIVCKLGRQLPQVNRAELLINCRLGGI